MWELKARVLSIASAFGQASQVVPRYHPHVLAMHLQSAGNLCDACATVDLLDTHFMLVTHRMMKTTTSVQLFSRPLPAEEVGMERRSQARHWFALVGLSNSVSVS